MKIKPYFGRVLLQREKAEKIGNILIPQDSAKRHASLKCRVLAKGPNADEMIRIGADVLIGRFAGDWLNAEGKPVSEMGDAEFFIVQDEDILAEVE